MTCPFDMSKRTYTVICTSAAEVICLPYLIGEDRRLSNNHQLVSFYKISTFCCSPKKYQAVDLYNLLVEVSSSFLGGYKCMGFI